MPQYLVAIEKLRNRARIAVIEATFRRAALTELREVELPPPPPASPSTEPEAGVEAAAVNEWELIRRALPAQVDAVAAVVDPGVVSTRLVEFPFGDARKVESALDFELESQMPFSLEDMAVAWAVCERAPQRTRVVAAVAPKDVLRATIAEMHAVDLEPRVVHTPGAALVELLRRDVEPQERVAVLSIGEHDAELVVARTAPDFVRTLRFGAASVDKALAKEFGLSPAQAVRARETEASFVAPDERSVSEERRRVSATLETAVAPLVTALATTFKSLPADQVPARLLVTGTLSRLVGLPEYLSRRLSLPVELLDLHESLGDLQLGVRSIGPEYANVVAMAMALWRHGSQAPLNLRTRDLAFKGDLQVYRGEILRLGAGLAIVFVLAMAGLAVQYSVISAEEAEINGAFCAATKKIIGREICDPTAALATLKSSGGEDGLFIPAYSAATLMEMISRSVDPSMDVTFDELDIRIDGRGAEPDRITGKGEAASFDTTEQVVAALKRDPCVHEAEISKQRKKRDSPRVEFDLSVKVRCPVGVVPGSAAQAAAAPPASDVEPQP